MTAGPMMQSAGRPAGFPHHAGSKAKYIAGQFLQQYYSVLQFRSKLLGRFYQDDSALTVAGLPAYSDDDPPVLGSEAIGVRAAEIFVNVKLVKEREDAAGYVFDAQEVSTEANKTNSILLHACGEMDIAGEGYRFFQTFFLAPQTEPAGFYVKHDVLRFVKEERPAALTAGAAATPRRAPVENGYAMMGAGYHGGHQPEAHLSQPMQAMYMPPPSAPLHPNPAVPYPLDPMKATLPQGIPPAAVSAPAGHPHQQTRVFPAVPPQQQQQAHVPLHHPVPPQPTPAHAPAPAPATAAAPHPHLPAPAIPPVTAPHPTPAAPVATAAPPAPPPAASAPPAPPVPVGAPAPAAEPAAVPVMPPAPIPAPVPAPALAAEPTPAPAEVQEDSPPQNLSYAERLKRSMQARPAAAAPAPQAPAAKPSTPGQPAPANPAVAPVAAVPAPVVTPSVPAADETASGAGSDDLDETASTNAESNCSVFVKNVPDATKEDVLEVFSQFGAIKGGANGVNVFMGKPLPGRTSVARFAYIDFESPSSAEAAIGADVDVKGSKVQVELKRGGRGPRGHRGSMSGRGSRSFGPRSDDPRRSFDGRPERPRMSNGSYKGRGGGAARPDGDRPMRGDNMEGMRGGRSGGRGRSDRDFRVGRSGMRPSDAPREPRAASPPKASE